MFVAAPLGAQEDTLIPAGILTIHQERLFTMSLYGERVQAEIEAASAALAAENRQIESELIAEEKALTEQRPTLDPEAFRVLADAFDEKVQGIRQAQDIKTRELGRKLEQERNTYYELVLPVLGELMKERGAVAILERRMVFASANSIDITEIAVRRIDATLGDGKKTAPAPEE